MKLDDVIKVMNASASGLEPALHARDIVSIAIDSRDVKAGDVFFALSQPEYRNNGFNGDFADATIHVPAAFESGAIACVVRRERFEEHSDKLREYQPRLIFVDDAVAALQRLAHEVYLRWGGQVVAVTGSAGKTTAKELAAAVLAAGGRQVLRNRKNFNNGIGHPLTVMELAADPSYEVAVLEMGMSTPMNEIARLCRITPPDVAVVLNVLPVHVEHLGSIENVARAKAELVEGMKAGGTAVLNADDERVTAMRSLSKGATLFFGLAEAAQIRASKIRSGGFGRNFFVLETPTGTAEVEIKLNGMHNISNALAAAAVGHLFGMTAGDIAKALAVAAAPEQRGEVLNFAAGFTVINDSYNSNPAALASTVDMLVSGAAGRTVVVAGEMLELGPSAAEAHRASGEMLARKGVDLLIGVRGLAAEMVDAAISGGIAKAIFAADSEQAAELLADEIRPGDTVLVKGSRGVRTEKVVEKLMAVYSLEEAGTAAR